MPMSTCKTISFIIVYNTVLFLYTCAEVGKYEVTEPSEVETFSNESIKWMLMPNGRDDVEPAIISGIYRSDDYVTNVNGVQFYLYTRENAQQAEVRQMNVTCLPVFKYFNSRKKTKIIIHGFGDNVKDSYMVPLIKDALLSRGDYNVMAIDWSDLAAKPWYLAAAHNTQPVAKHVARFIDHMSSSTGTKAEDIHIIGFSLGAHIAGLASRNMRSGNVKHITGLDPAYVLFSSTGPDRRLDSSQADLVEVIHTSGGYIGFEKPLGHRDFYPNGGLWPQPGCVIDYAAVCSHRRAYFYYSESIKNSRAFKSTPCDSYFNFLNKNCSVKDVESLDLGKITFDKKRYRGLYFLSTNPTSPYGKDIAEPDLFEEISNLIS